MTDRRPIVWSVAGSDSGGGAVIQADLRAFEDFRVHGCTAHFVTEQLDEGPVILQDVFHINVGADTLADVKEKGLTLESQVLSKAVQLYLDEELVVVEGKVIFKPGISRFLHAAG